MLPSFSTFIATLLFSFRMGNLGTSHLRSYSAAYSRMVRNILTVHSSRSLVIPSRGTYTSEDVRNGVDKRFVSPLSSHDEKSYRAT